MNISDLKGKKITVMGLGFHGGGVGTARFLCESGARVTVTDMKSQEELTCSISKLKGLKNIRYVLSQHRTEDFAKADMVVKTPGAPWNNKYIQLAISNKIPVEVDSSLFFKLCRNKIIGVTGTKGKTTTASLIAEILKAGGKNVVQVGIGQISVLDKLKELKKDSIVVFELSSWRASALERVGLSPWIGVMTNIYRDHMNYYKTLEAYIKDKKCVYLNQKKDDFCIVNHDDIALSALESEIKSQLVRVSTKEKLRERGVYQNDGIIYLNDGIEEKVVIKDSEISLRGKHNISNVLLSIAATYVAGIKIPTIRKVVSGFKGVVHRLELVREIRGVRYYNDTAATMPEAAISGLNSFDSPVILICGGADKNLDMAEFGKEIVRKAKGVVFFKGMGTDKIIHSIKDNLNESDLDRKFKIVETMEKAVELAKREAEAGDVVLLSPGAASFGIFKNEFDRGDTFRVVVNGLK
jgi:UDP-N-acetylmuramoylalanine--D-glutamate ligase